MKSIAKLTLDIPLRSHKMAFCSARTPLEEYMLDDAEIMIVAYGHTARSARWAIKEARKKGMKVGMLTLRTLYPFPEEKVKRWSKVTRCVLIPEMNQGQLFYVVRESSFSPVISLPQTDGESINPRRILHFLETMGKNITKTSLPSFPLPSIIHRSGRETRKKFPRGASVPKLPSVPGVDWGF